MSVRGRKIKYGLGGTKPYHPTPVGPRYTEEEREALRKRLPHGTHPRMESREHSGAQFSYYVPPVPIPPDAVHPYDLTNFATLTIAGVPSGPTLDAQRDYWERELLDAYFHLYGESWAEWRRIIPWLLRRQIRARAVTFVCEQPWNWMAKRHFLESHHFAWSLDDLNYLIDRYPDRQRNDREQGIFVAEKPFAEIQEVAKTLGLPSKEVLDTLADYARMLNAG